MKSIFTILICLSLSFSSFAQLADFEETVLPQDTFWNGIDQTGGFESGDIFYFPNFYNTNFGGYWAEGWALSSVMDSTTSGPANLYGSKALTGYQSNQYAVGQQNSIIKLQDTQGGHGFGELYITNTTYAHNSMRDSDQFAKAFGGESGDDPDYFKLVIWGYFNGTLSTTDSVEFYLADYRFEDNSQDYIVDSWTQLSLAPLENADSLLFTLSSTDTTAGFINTPSFFCIDRLQASLPASTNDLELAKVQVSPNPATEFLQVDFPQIYPQLTLEILDTRGAKVFSKSIENQDRDNLDISALPSGVYFLHVQGEQSIIKKFIKL